MASEDVWVTCMRLCTIVESGQFLNGQKTTNKQHNYIHTYPHTGVKERL